MIKWLRHSQGIVFACPSALAPAQLAACPQKPDSNTCAKVHKPERALQNAAISTFSLDEGENFEDQVLLDLTELNFLPELSVEVSKCLAKEVTKPVEEDDNNHAGTLFEARTGAFRSAAAHVTHRTEPPGEPVTTLAEEERRSKIEINSKSMPAAQVEWLINHYAELQLADLLAYFVAVREAQLAA